MKRPTCQVAGCNTGAQNAAKKPDGSIRWRKSKGRYICGTHHGKKIAKKHGVKTIGHVLAKNAGFESPTAYTNSMHPYLKYRKDYCENVDSRLGYKCTSTIVWDGQLSVDHIDENHENNDNRNHHTLCHNCHWYKTNLVRRLFSNKERDNTVWKILKNMLRFSGKDTTNQIILKIWEGKYA
jgi:hypothetical protein